MNTKNKMRPRRKLNGSIYSVLDGSVEYFKVDTLEPYIMGTYDDISDGTLDGIVHLIEIGIVCT